MISARTRGAHVVVTGRVALARGSAVREHSQGRGPPVPAPAPQQPMPRLARRVGGEAGRAKLVQDGLQEFCMESLR